ncbi:hypothetical protein NPX13_g9684 [Xylaria arbuscula]|uniref:Retrovirus-related Pol polyprotein from transposon TNT 1-94-like beta-barrel domain-containing protein n=1 Tax=Xylaria arbuscula TaxID=114810 RepID=A0A9W8N688_9PEZI|nr:hypothetical protein NPX13_g9684 [Xylaria arbuscula]
MVNQTAIQADQLTYIDIAAALRQYALTCLSPPRSSRALKGAFPTYNTNKQEETDKDDQVQDKLDRSDPRRLQGRGQGRAGNRGRDLQRSIPKRPRANTQVCKAYQGFHNLEKCWFLNFRRAKPGDMVIAGDSAVPILGYGEVDINVQGPKGPEVMRLPDVAYCEDFSTNIVSLKRLQQSSYWHLMQESLGAKIKKDSEAEIAITDYDACAQAKLRRQVRRTKQIRPSKPGIRIAIDFHDFEKTTYSNNSMMIATDRYSGYTWDHFFKNRQTKSVKVIKCDNKILKHKDGLEALRDTFPDYKITFKPSAANTQGQNRAAERLGGIIKDKARAMRLGSNLPKSLWPEIIKAAIYLYNRIWNPLNNRIESTRDIQFQEKSFYTGNPEDLQKDARELLPRTIKILLAKRDLQETQPETINKYPKLDHKVYQNVAEDSVKEQGNSENKESVFRIQATGSKVTCKPNQLYTQAIFVPYPSPPESPTLSNLFTATIRKADLVVRPAEAALVASKPRFKIKEDPFNLYTIVSARKSCWEATFNSGRLCTTESFHGMPCKARLVIRGDQQPYSSSEETYASTLAGRSFRTLMAIAAKFDLELKQYDAVNAFVNAKLDKEIYIRMPPGYRKSGLGYSPVPHKPCCYSKNRILMFIYVDDIVLAYQSSQEASAIRLIRELKTKYQLTGGDDLQWFLGVEVIRDRQQKLIWLSQSSYIEKISKLSDSKEKKHPTPIKIQELLPYRGLATAKEIHAYQKKIGSIIYAAVITRPDIAFPASRLSQFNLNPSPKHHREADQTLDYLLQTQYYALKFRGGNDLIVASDSSFADNTIDRKSSQAYVIKLFGGVIGWRANKQDTITTSTTEAELLALAQAAKEAMFVSRLIKELGVTLNSQQITLQCDNQQTIRLLKKEVSTLKTKLRHIDIHNHWLRQEVQQETLDITYVPTGDIIADRLTKALPATK